jgi:hypothetical protein
LDQQAQSRQLRQLNPKAQQIPLPLLLRQVQSDLLAQQAQSRRLIL